MFIKDIAIFIPNVILSSILKTVRVDIDHEGKQQILKNGLYHITKNRETAEIIIKSQHIRPATGLIKNINSYGTACVCLFNGTPSIENYMKNLVANQSQNPYVNPTIVLNAVKISPKTEEELANYKVRGLQDNAIIYEGYCILPQEETQSVYLVPDLVRDYITGKPIINSKTGKYDISFREAAEDELTEDKNTYNAQEDYLSFMAKERQRLGYFEKGKLITNSLNTILSVLHIERIEGKMSYTNLIGNLPQIIKRKIQQFLIPKLDMGSDEKIKKAMNEFTTEKKNPYRDKKFGEAVARFQAEGLRQLDLKTELERITTSDIGKYFRNKYTQIDKSVLQSNGIHGISHNNRVALYSMIIAQNEGVLDNDKDNRIKDILLMASYYHDIGRKKGIIINNFSPHSKKGARRVGKMNLYYLNGKHYSAEDKRILQAIIESHEGKDKDMIKICEKYKIREEDIVSVVKLMNILKDADSLDRTRLDFNNPTAMHTNLNPRYLRTNTSKQLLNLSYQFETLSQKVSFDRIIAYKTEAQQESKEKDVFVEKLKQGVKLPIQNLKRKLQLRKQEYATRLSGTGIINRLKETNKNTYKTEMGEER